MSSCFQPQRLIDRRRPIWTMAAATVVVSLVWKLAVHPFRAEPWAEFAPSVSEVSAGLAVPEEIERPLARWIDPSIQRRGDGWLFELFAPPTLFRDREAGGWSLEPPILDAPASEGEIPGVEAPPVSQPSVVGIGMELFPLQLVGYGRGAGGLFGTFQNAATLETFVARAGRKIDPLGLRIDSLTEMLLELPQGDEEPLRQRAAVARVILESSGEQTLLRSSERVSRGVPRAAVRLSPAGETSWLAEGESIQTEQGAFRVERIETAPQRVVVSDLTGATQNPPTREFFPPLRWLPPAGPGAWPPPVPSLSPIP